MPRYKLTVEYHGGPYIGWQRQQQGMSVQRLLEEALQALCHHEVTLYGAGRTDAGVHALGQVCHTDLEKDFPPLTVLRAANYYLREQKIAVLTVEKVTESFHARFSAKSRAYTYRILNRYPPPALEEGRVWHVRPALDVIKMQEGAQYLIGYHDFTTFRATFCQAKSSQRTLTQLTVCKRDDLVEITAEAPSFLHHQVRNIVGSLAMVGLGRWQPRDIDRILQACDRSKGGPTAPAMGLYFTKVNYS